MILIMEIVLNVCNVVKWKFLSSGTYVQRRASGWCPKCHPWQAGQTSGPGRNSLHGWHPGEGQCHLADSYHFRSQPSANHGHCCTHHINGHGHQACWACFWRWRSGRGLGQETWQFLHQQDSRWQPTKRWVKDSGDWGMFLFIYFYFWCFINPVQEI